MIWMIFDDKISKIYENEASTAKSENNNTTAKY
jgi:hypothetical protein